MNMPRTGLAPFKTRTRGPAPVERKKAPMMADGGFGAPPPIGDESDSAPPAPDMGEPPPPDPGAGAGAVSVRPESVNYHDDAQSCGACQYMEGTQCAVLNMQVSPDGGCNAFEAKAAGGDDEATETPDDESMEGEGPPPGGFGQ